MSALVVVVAAASATNRAVGAVLRDWAALGLVRPHLWVDEPDVDARAPFGTVVATWVTADGAQRVRLQDHLANLHQLDVLRLVTLESATDRLTRLDEDVAGHLYTNLDAMRAGRVSALQVVLTRHGSAAWQPGVERLGWHTLVVAPEDAWNPASPITELLADSDDTEFEAHAAAGLAGPAALWTGMTVGPFDDREAAGSEAPMVVRSFLRWLDAGAVTGELRRALTDVSRGLPRPRNGAERCEHLEAPEVGSATVATAVLERNAALFTLDLEQPVLGERRVIGAWAAILEFFAFLGAALRRAPGHLRDRVLAGGAAGVSRRVQHALYGEDSQFEVVTRGVNAHGLPAGVEDLSVLARQVQQRTAPVVGGEYATPDLRPFWRDVVGGSLTLADAGDRVPGAGPVAVGGRLGVVPAARFVAPGVDDTFALPASARMPSGGSVLSPYDVRAHEQAARAVEAAEGSGSVGHDSAERLQTWRRAVTDTYTGLVGMRLAAELERRGELLRQLLAQLAESGADDEAEDAVAAGQHATRRIVVTFLVGLLGIVLVAALVFGLDLVRPLVLGLVVLVLVLAWTARTVVAVVRQQQRVFALLYARRQREEALEVAGRNVPRVAAGVQTATVLYRQYLAWAPVLGRFLAEPFGAVAEPEPPARLAGLLPRAVGLGTARPDPDAIAETAHRLAEVVYERGWLSELWEAFVSDAPRRLGRAGFDLRPDPMAALLRDPVRADDSPLRLWSDLVSREGVASAAGDGLWNRARDVLLRGGVAELTGSLFASVDVQAQEGHGITQPQRGTEFLTGLTDSLADVSQHHFASGLFTPLAVAQGDHRVASTTAVARAGTRELAGGTARSGQVHWLEAGGDEAGLDQFVVVVQAGPVVGSSLLRLRGPASPRPEGRADRTRDQRLDDLEL